MTRYGLSLEDSLIVLLLLLALLLQASNFLRPAENQQQGQKYV